MPSGDFSKNPVYSLQHERSAIYHQLAQVLLPVVIDLEIVIKTVCGMGAAVELIGDVLTAYLENNSRIDTVSLNLAE